MFLFPTQTCIHLYSQSPLPGSNQAQTIPKQISIQHLWQSTPLFSMQHFVPNSTLFLFPTIVFQILPFSCFQNCVPNSTLSSGTGFSLGLLVPAGPVSDRTIPVWCIHVTPQRIAGRIISLAMKDVWGLFCWINSPVIFIHHPTSSVQMLFILWNDLVLN